MVLFLVIGCSSSGSKIRSSGKLRPEIARKIELAKRKNRLKRKKRTESGRKNGSPQYTGVADCRICHPKQYKVWKKTLHAKAFKTLFSDEAQKIAQGLKIKKAYEAPECLVCHNSQSPTFKGFDFDESFARIEHS